MIMRINESQTLTKHVSCECKCKFDETKCKSNQLLNSNKCQCEYKERVLNSATCNCENGKSLVSIMDRVVCDEIIDVKETNFDEKI